MITTSNFAKVSKLPNCVSIAVGNPHWFRGLKYAKLAPQMDWVKKVKSGEWTSEDYQVEYQKVLDQLNPMEVVQELEKLVLNPILVCWEGFNVRCHRRYVAEWLETETGIVVPEYDHERTESLTYSEMTDKPVKTSSAKKSKKDSNSLQGWLF